MKALGKEGKWREVMSVLRKLQRDAKTDSALRPDLVVFNAAVGAVSKSGRWEEVSALLNKPFGFAKACTCVVVCVSCRFTQGDLGVYTRRRTSSKDPLMRRSLTVD